MIGIVGMPPCGFGNRMLYYYNLRQESHKRGCEFFCVPWVGHRLFEGNMLGTPPRNQSYENLGFCLGEKFYDDSGLSTRDVFKLKTVPEVPSNTCAIHFRGTDFHTWNPQSILKSQYYCDSIDEIKDEVSNFILFTDDADLESYKNVKDYLTKGKHTFSLGTNTADRNNFVSDFFVMSACDYIISSPSTYGICAGFIGKQKKIIHSKEWVEYRVAKEDKFWCDLYDGGNDDYKLWRMI